MKYILSKRPFRKEFLDRIAQIAPEYQFETDPTNVDWQQVQITVGWQKDWEKQLLTPNSSLAWVQSLSAGVDTLPLAQFQQQGIILSNASGIHTRSITEHVLACLFMDVRGFPKAIANQQKHLWSGVDMRYGYLSEQKILIMGTGEIGQELAKSLGALNITTTGINTTGHKAAGFSRTAPITDLLTEAAEADYIVNILPLTPETHHLYNQHFFANVKSSAAFLNVGRGASVDTQALTDALQQGRLRQAYLDVVEEEPLTSDHPLWQMENCLITPHISGMTPHFEKAFMEIFLENLEVFVKDGKLRRNQVTLKAGY